MNSRYPKHKINIIGGGIIGAMEAYFAFLEAKEKNETIRVTIHERYTDLKNSTTANIVPSLTPDEILSVVPRGQELTNKLSLLFSEPGGIRVDDAANVNRSAAAEHFKTSAQEYSKDEAGHQDRTKKLFTLGKMSMELWQKFYDHADPELRKILDESNFNSCEEISDDANNQLHHGYRIDLIYNIPGATTKANAMKEDYQALGYHQCKLLPPDEAMKIDPSLKDFCRRHSHYDAAGERVWNKDAAALWRPGGCLDTQKFIPKFYNYLSTIMGTYINDEGKEKNCFRLKLDKNVEQVNIAHPHEDTHKIVSMKFFGRDKIHQNNDKHDSTEYVFCPGEAVGTLNKLGFDEPAYAGFAGPSLMINIPLDESELKQYSQFNHCMEVHQEGVVLAWQARVRDNKIFIGVGGTKAFYADQRPHVNQQFALNRNLLQLNMINDILPAFISKALGKNTTGKKLTADDLRELETKQIATRWVGVRAVAYDGFPTLGHLYINGTKVENGRCTTHLGSGGVSFAPAAVFASRSVMHPAPHNPIIEDVLAYAASKRHC